MEKKKKVNWSDLPPELWPMIGKRLDNRVDVPLSPIFSKPFSLLCSTVFFPFGRHGCRTPSFALSNHSVPNSTEPWLVKFEEYDSGNMRLLDAISNKPLRCSPIAHSSKQLNLLDFRVVELRKSYSVNLRNVGNFVVLSVNKVVVMGPNYGDDCVIFMICNEGALAFWRFGDKKWTNVDTQNSHYDDVIVYKGQCYVVDRWGTVSWVNSELNAIRVSPPSDGLGWEKHLVESCGDLYVVDRYFHKERPEKGRIPGDQDEEFIFGPFCLPPPNTQPLDPDAEAVDFEVYKLDQERVRWVDMKNLGDQVFILSNDGSFSVSSRDFARVKGNCILFTMLKLGDLPIDGAERSYRLRVFNLEDGSITTPAALSGYSWMLHPPSACLNEESDGLIYS